MVYSYTQEEIDAAFGNTSTPTEFGSVCCPPAFPAVG